jgi:hypothetical protein
LLQLLSDAVKEKFLHGLKITPPKTIVNLKWFAQLFFIVFYKLKDK